MGIKMHPIEAIHFRVSGKVQGVGYRFSTRETAISLNLLGWVKNLSSGQVEVLAQGPTTALEALLEWCQQGPPSSHVKSIEILSRGTVDTPTFSSFTIQYDE